MSERDPVPEILPRLPALLEDDSLLLERGRFLDVDCILGSTQNAYHVAIRSGRIIELVPAPILMRSWTFAFRASPLAWIEFWKPMPKPGWHDLLALTKRGEATLEGDIRPFMTNLQYFKDVLALPRSTPGGAA